MVDRCHENALGLGILKIWSKLLRACIFVTRYRWLNLTGWRSQLIPFVLTPQRWGCYSSLLQVSASSKAGPVFTVGAHKHTYKRALIQNTHIPGHADPPQSESSAGTTIHADTSRTLANMNSADGHILLIPSCQERTGTCSNQIYIQTIYVSSAFGLRCSVYLFVGPHTLVSSCCLPVDLWVLEGPLQTLVLRFLVILATQFANVFTCTD